MSIPQIDAARTDVVSTRVNYLQFINGRMSQRSLALRLGTPPASLSNKITGRTAWNLDELFSLCDIFAVSADYLLGREPIESARPVNAEGPASIETGPSGVVAGAGFEPTTSGL